MVRSRPQQPANRRGAGRGPEAADLPPHRPGEEACQWPRPGGLVAAGSRLALGRSRQLSTSPQHFRTGAPGRPRPGRPARLKWVASPSSSRREDQGSSNPGPHIFRIRGALWSSRDFIYNRVVLLAVASCCWNCVISTLPSDANRLAPGEARQASRAGRTKCHLRPTTSLE